jgi:hypothetical protein
MFLWPLFAFGFWRSARATTPPRARLALKVGLWAFGAGVFGACFGGLRTMNPGGGTNFMLSANIPAREPALGALLFGMIGIGATSVVPLWIARRALARRAFALCMTGAWWALALALLVVLGRATHLELGRWLRADAAVATALVLASAVVARQSAESLPRATLAVASVAAAFGLAATWTPLLPRKYTVPADEALCVQDWFGVVRTSRSTPLQEYSAPGLNLRKVECSMTFEFGDESHLVKLIIGRDARGADHTGRELFSRIRGTPEARARAACDLLYGEGCHRILTGPTIVAGGTHAEAEPPLDRGDRLVFYSIFQDFIYGRQTYTGMMEIVMYNEVAPDGSVLVSRPRDGNDNRGRQNP